MTSLAIVVYNTSTSSWDPVESVLDSANTSISASITHFSVYALIGKIVTTTTTPPPQYPAVFNTSDLTVSPTSVLPGQTVTISAKVSNTGGSSGEYDVTVKINGVFEGTQKVTVNTGSSSSISFSVIKNTPGHYEVDVNGAIISFTIEQITPITSSTQPQISLPTNDVQETNWLVVIIPIVSIIIIGGIISMILVRKKHASIK